MELNGEELIPLNPVIVWDGLNDSEVLKASIPGCETIEKVGDDRYNLVMLAAVGPLKARFNGKLTLVDVKVPECYTLVFEGSGGVAGFGKGKAVVSLAAVDAGTALSYRASAQVGGKMAQVGSRLIDGVAAKMAAEFFTRFKATLALPAETQEADKALMISDGAEPDEKSAKWKFWK